MTVKKFATTDEWVDAVSRRIAQKAVDRMNSVLLARATFRSMAAALSRGDLSLPTALLPANHFANMCGLDFNRQWENFRNLERGHGHQS